MKKPRKTSLSETTIDDLFELHMKRIQKELVIQSQIDEIVKEGINLLPIKKQKRLERLSSKLNKIYTL